MNPVSLLFFLAQTIVQILSIFGSSFCLTIPWFYQYFNNLSWSDASIPHRYCHFFMIQYMCPTLSSKLQWSVKSIPIITYFKRSSFTPRRLNFGRIECTEFGDDVNKKQKARSNGNSITTTLFVPRGHRFLEIYAF